MRALITGITGQDGSYLAELLAGKGYEVHGLGRDAARAAGSPNLSAVSSRIRFWSGDLRDSDGLRRIVHEVGPIEIYHLAGQTHVGASFGDVEGTLRDNVLSTAALLDAAKRIRPAARFFFASTSQVFGRPPTAPQDEATPFRPISPYGVSKACATDLVRVAREAEGLHAVSGILYNHESPRRGPEFVTGKICRAAAAAAKHPDRKLKLGDVSARRDWGDAREYVEGFWRSLQAPQPDDYIFATGRLHSVEDLLAIAFGAVGRDWREHVEVDPSLFRPAEPGALVGNSARAKERLGWAARQPFRELITEMVEFHRSSGAELL